MKLARGAVAHKFQLKVSTCNSGFSNILYVHYTRFFPIIFPPRTTGPSYLLCFAMRANLVLKFLRVSSGKITTHIILDQPAAFDFTVRIA